MAQRKNKRHSPLRLSVLRGNAVKFLPLLVFFTNNRGTLHHDDELNSILIMR
jgi:hypothetical protein